MPVALRHSDIENGTVPSLAALDFFTEVQRERLAELEKLCEFRTFSPNEIILKRGSSTEDALFLLDGEARVVIEVEDGEEIKLATIGGRDVIGALSALDGEARSASVVANKPSIVATMPRSLFVEVLKRDQGVAFRLLQRFSAIIRTLNTRVKDLSLLSPEQRLYTELLRLARPIEETPGQLSILDTPGHDDLASWANTTREVVAYSIGMLARRGIVERKHKTLYIRDPEALRDLAAARHETH
jgi:CRP/FNR family transcriptional regulator, cyclic AMP receptor protein